MADTEATLNGNDNKQVTITISEDPTALASELTIEPGTNGNTFIISNGKFKLTITIAE